MRELKLEMQVSLDGFAADAEGGMDWMVWNWGNHWSWDDKLRSYHTELIASSDCIYANPNMRSADAVGEFELLALRQ